MLNTEPYLHLEEPVEMHTHIHTPNLSEKHTPKNPHKHTHTRTHAHTSKTCTHTHKRKHICIYSKDLCVDALFSERARALAFK